MADYGIKVSQNGFNVGTCADKDLVMSSAFNMLKTCATGTKATAGTIAHGLAYTPIFFTTTKIGTTNTYTLIGDDASYCGSISLTTYSNNTRYYIFYQQF